MIMIPTNAPTLRDTYVDRFDFAQEMELVMCKRNQLNFIKWWFFKCCLLLRSCEDYDLQQYLSSCGLVSAATWGPWTSFLWPPRPISEPRRRTTHALVALPIGDKIDSSIQNMPVAVHLEALYYLFSYSSEGAR